MMLWALFLPFLLIVAACGPVGQRHIPVDVLPTEPDAWPMADLDAGSAGPDLDGTGDLQLTDGPALPDGGSGPPYPYILVHGFFGFDKVGPLDYWYKLKPALVADGHDVHIASMDPFNTTYVRGPQLLKQVKQVLASTGAAKVNLVAHSQGGWTHAMWRSSCPEKSPR